MTPKRMTPKRIGDLLHRIGCLRHPCDLDLLLFFSRHPRAFLLSERLAEYVGYDLTQVMQSLETLLDPSRATLRAYAGHLASTSSLVLLLPALVLGAELRLRESLLNAQRDRVTATITAVVDHIG